MYCLQNITEESSVTVQSHSQGRNDTMKKKYIKPTIIDLSIEGMTGFGYGVLSANCLDGYQFAAGSCGRGAGVNSSCSEGSNPTNECSNGNLPSDRGTICVYGNSANGRICLTGPTVSGFNPWCDTGGSGVGTSGNPDCDSGLTANYCVEGNSNVGGFS